ncbi:ubiquinone/menaquinone biosynthesis C-methylase UbiE [Fontibacillus phaseoli]|uniref:Ubiquinone/menaquinone biosynthesis C-methylase UbiE n=1 Tax=Fontibacillus phaseoli TaxID=1416533 RepID=A0A369BGE6_9BACL|nr:class I SAM-dependent methyltransferase [Fontibacillus phaseoli]RCX20325.1 ubiquinone/menaquinone biosynthesis C-methylase UbiE [Fontibacillus phaseoli]
MPIDFHDAQNRQTYSTRTADGSWSDFIRERVDISGKKAADVGCGGGIYTKALAELGASSVVGVDFSDEVLASAAINCRGLQEISLVKGEAYQSGLPAREYDLVLERALIHHLDDLNACFTEANRILKKGGLLMVQDRTPADCLLPGDIHHIRGYFFQKYPQLAGSEISRRYESEQVQRTLQASGFKLLETASLWETRMVHPDLEALRQDLLHRTGRSLLHELNDGQLDELVSFISGKFKDHDGPIVESDAWSIWFAVPSE